jgi:hypothetical protein
MNAWSYTSTSAYAFVGWYLVQGLYFYFKNWPVKEKQGFRKHCPGPTNMFWDMSLLANIETHIG